MGTVKVAITMDEGLLKHLDRLVKNCLFENRSRAIQEAVSEKLARASEQTMAEEGMSIEAAEWPE